MPLLAADDRSIVFETLTLSTEFHAEGAAIGDFDRDGANDVVSGPFIYFGPDFKSSTKIYDAPRFDVRSYSKNFLCYVHDISGDGFDDVVVMGFPGEEGYWFENPKGELKAGPAQPPDRELGLRQRKAATPRADPEEHGARPPRRDRPPSGA